MLKAVIVDDEDHSRSYLKKAIEDYAPEVKVVAMASNIESGKKAIDQYKPQIAFLDVELNEGTSFEIIQQLDHKDLSIIFITAHDQYAIDAFQLSAVDYLLKPASPDDIVKAVNKAISQIQQQEWAQFDGSIRNLLAHPQVEHRILFLAGRRRSPTR